MGTKPCGMVELEVETKVVLATILSVLDETAEAELSEGIGEVYLTDVQYLKTLDEGRRILLRFAWMKK